MYAVPLATARNLACGLDSNVSGPPGGVVPAQISRFLCVALEAGPIRLPRLAKLAVYLNAREEGLRNKPDFVGDLAPVPPHHSGPGACAAIGRLVTSGVLPALAQACLPSPQQQASHAHATCT